MKILFTPILFVLLFSCCCSGQEFKLQGVIDVWNSSGTTILLTDDFFYSFAPGDVLTFEIKGTANIAPYDEERKGGGFLGMFKKSYSVRIDNWVNASDAILKLKISDYNDVTLIKDETNKTQKGVFSIPFNLEANKLKEELLKNFKLNAWIDQYMTSLRAGKYDITVSVNSSARLPKLKAYFESSQVTSLPILNFENDIRKFVENGKLIYRHPDETVRIIEGTLSQRPNIEGIKKDLYKYLLNFAPDNTTVRAGLAEVYLKELNFSEAQVQAQKTIVLLSAKVESTLTNKEKSDFGRAYEVIAGVNDLKELGLQESA